MIDGNVIKFGYGDIAVGAMSILQYMKFTEIKPPHECGTNLDECDDCEYVSKPICISFDTYDEIKLYKDYIKQVKSKEILVFEFKSFIFDFTNYNIESVKVCERHINRIEGGYTLALAC